jgi:dienelactone hydrolase
MAMKNGIFLCAVVFGSLAGQFPVLHSQTGEVAPTPTNSESAAKQASTFKLPDPSGPYRIGRVGYEWVDNTRPDGYSTEPRAHRDLMVYLWYPARRDAIGQTEPYLPGAKQMDANPDLRPQMQEEYGALWPLVVSGELRSHAIENAPIANTPKRFPVVILSHGAGGTSVGYTSLIEELVSHGYVVAAIEHTYTASAVAFPDGRVVVAHRDPAPAGLSADQQWKRMAESATLAINRGASDVLFTLNKLAQMNEDGTPAFPLKGRLDLRHVASVGHSAGGAFATLACQLDARIDACISLDGEMPPVAAFPETPHGEDFHQPVLLLEVDPKGRRMPFSLDQYNDFVKKEEAQLNLCLRGSYHVFLKAPGLLHGSFSDYWLRLANGNATQTEEALHNLHLTESFTRAFLDKYLKGEKAPLLDSPTLSPEAVVKEYGH